MKFFRSTLGRYVTAFSAFGVAIALTFLLRSLFGSTFTGYLFLYIFAIMAAALRGYGPGILVTLATAFFVPYLFVPGYTPARISIIRTALALVMSILISRVSQSRAHSEDALRKSNEELDKRVQLRTEDLERSNAALRESEERFSLFMRHLPGAAWMKDLSGRYVYANLTAEVIFRTPLEKLRGRTDDQIFPPEVARQFQQNDRQALNARKNLQTVETLPQDDGIHYSVVSKFPISGPDGNPVMVGGVAIDITERRKAEEESHNRLAELENLYRAAPVALGLVNDDLQYVRVNDQLAAINGIPAKDHIGRSIRDILSPSLADIVEPLYRQVIATGQPVIGREVHGAVLAQPGVEKDWLIGYSPVKTEEGRVIAIQLVIQDITEKKRFDEHLLHTAKLESLGVLAGGIAHDFNNLLVGIMGNASLVLDNLPPTSPVRPLAEDIVAASERAAQLTGQMLAYSGRGRFVVQKVDVSDLIRQTVPLIQVSIPRIVELRLDLGHSLPPVEIDVTQIEQLIMNLIINGAEAIPEARPGVVTISSFERLIGESDLETAGGLAAGSYVAIEVRDDGCGMDERTKSRIFDPFFTTKFTGRGLGLAAVLGIVRGHKGRIQVDTIPGRGSAFQVLLPAAAGRAVRTEITDSPSTAELEGSGTILVVDDEPAVRGMAQTALERFGYTVLIAKNGQDALDVFARYRSEISLVLLDMAMPKMGGERTIVELKKINPDIPVVLSSGYSEAEVIPRFQGHGLAGFLQKPYSTLTLASKVKTAIAGNGSRS